jgi:hypothetical protein
VSNGPAADGQPAGSGQGSTTDQDAVISGVANRLAVFIGQMTGADSAALPAIADLSADVLTALAATLIPGIPVGVLLAQLLKPGAASAAAGLATLTSAEIDSFMRRAIAAAMPTLDQLGVLAAAKTPPKPPTRSGAAAPPGSGNAKPTLPPAGTGWSWDDITGSGLGNLPPLPTEEEIKRVSRLGKLESYMTARWMYDQWGEIGDLGIPGTPPWSEVLEQWVMAKMITEALPLIAEFLAGFGLTEVPSNETIGPRVHKRIMKAYIDLHPDNLVAVDWWVATPGDWKSEVDREKRKRGTLFDYVSGKASTGSARDNAKLAVAAYGLWFAQKGFDGPKRKLRADILDLTNSTVFEIKPIRGYPDGVFQVWAYQAFLNAAFSTRKDLPTVTRGWWVPLPVVFPVSDDKRLWAIAFMFPGLGDIPGIPGVIGYLVVRTEGTIEDLEPIAEAILAIIVSAVWDTLQAPQPGQQPPAQEPPQPDDTIPDEDPDSWPGEEEEDLPEEPFPGEDSIPNGRAPGNGEAPPPWPEPLPVPPLPVPPAQAPAQRSAGQAIEDFLAEYWVVIAVIVGIIALVVLAVLVFTAPAWGPVAAGVAVVIVIVLAIRKLMDGSSGPVTATTAALLEARGTAAWGDVVTFISSLSGIDPATLRSLDLGTPPAAPS